MSCGKWTEIRRDAAEKREEAWFLQWTFGFLTAAGQFDDYDMEPRDIAAFAIWLDKFCSQNPLDQFGEAVHTLHIELKERN